MKTPKDFDYDLWTSTDGGYFIRIKSTGETCEVNRETMRLLRNEEKKLRRELQGITISVSKGKEKTKETISVTILSLDYAVEGEELETALFADKTDYEEIVITKLREQEFCKLLTDLQFGAYKNCLINGMSYVEYGNLAGVHEATVRSSIRCIRKKAKKFFKYTTI